MARVNKRYKKRNPKKRNPAEGGSSKMPGLTEVAELAVPGFGAFALSRFATRAVSVQVAKRFSPATGKHAGAATAVTLILAAWLLAHRNKHTSKYQLPLVVGSIIAGVQSLLQLYFPKIGWIVSDASDEMNAIGNGSYQSPQIAAGGTRAALPPNFQPVDDADPNLYVFDDDHNAAANQQATTAAQNQTATDEDALLAELEAEDQNGGLGIFAQN